MSWPPAPGIRLAGRVVELTPCVPERDAAELYEALNHDQVWRHTPGRGKDPVSYVKILAARQEQGRFIWVVRLLERYRGLAAGQVVGTTSYLEVAPTDARLE